MAEVGYEKLLNWRGTSSRRLGDAAQATVVDCASAKEIILTHLSVIKRPVVVWPGGQITIGFELAGVLIVGVLSLLVPSLFAHPTVWSYFGMGYLFIPLIMPILGLRWLRTHPEAKAA